MPALCPGQARGVPRSVKTPQWSAVKRGPRHSGVAPCRAGSGVTARHATGGGDPPPAPHGAPLPSSGSKRNHASGEKLRRENENAWADMRLQQAPGVKLPVERGPRYSHAAKNNGLVNGPGREEAMSRAKIVTFVLTAIAGACIALSPAFADLKTIEEAAKKEGEVTWYVANVDARNAETAGRTFTTKYGIKVTVVRAASQIMYQRLAQDLAQNVANADVFGSVDVGNLVTLKQNGSLAKYVPENAAKLHAPFQNLDPDGFFHAVVASALVIGYNKDKVSAADVPKSWKDLNNPKWANRIALGHPAYSGFAGNWAVQVHKLYGKPYLEGLEKLKPQVGRSLFDAINLINSGERWLTATPLAPVMENADKGNPVAIQYPEEGAILVATPAGILKNAPHPNAAKLFMEFLQSPAFNEIMVKARYESMRPEVQPLPGVKPITEVKLIRPTIGEVIDGIPKVAEIWRDVFGQ